MNILLERLNSGVVTTKKELDLVLEELDLDFKEFLEVLFATGVVVGCEDVMIKDTAVLVAAMVNYGIMEMFLAELLGLAVSIRQVTGAEEEGTRLVLFGEETITNAQKEDTLNLFDCDNFRPLLESIAEFFLKQKEEQNRLENLS